MATPTIRIKRGTTVPGTGVLSAGELGMDLANKNLYIGQNDGTPLAVGGEGTFATRAYAESLVDALGQVFEYVATVDGGADEANATDLTLLAKKETGDYYKVGTAGYFSDGASTFYANLNDGLVWNTSSEIDIIDNTNSTVQGTLNEIAVTGSTDTGFTVAVDSAFSTRVSNNENKTQNISLTGTTSGVTDFNDTELNNVAAIYASDILHLEGVNIAEVKAPDIILEGQVAVTGDVAVTGNISATGTVSGTNITDLESKTQNIDLAQTVAGTTQINDKLVVGLGSNGGPELVVAGVMVPELFKVSGESVTIIGPATGMGDPSGDFKVTGKSVFTGEVSISGNTDLGADLSISGSIVDVTNISAAGSLEVTGATTLNGSATVVDKVDVKSAGWVDGQAGGGVGTRVTIEGTNLLLVDEATGPLDTTYGIAGITANVPLGDYTIATAAAVGDIVINSSDSTKKIQLKSSLVVADSGIEATGTTYVGPDSTGTTGVWLYPNGDLTASGIVTLDGSVGLAGALDVGGATTLGSTLDVTGDATFQSSVAANGDISTTQNLVVAGNIYDAIIDGGTW